jgi:hypothetical protein
MEPRPRRSSAAGASGMRRRSFLTRTLGAAACLSLPAPLLADRASNPRDPERTAPPLAATLALHYMTWLDETTWPEASTWPLLRNPAYPLPRGYDSTDPFVFRAHNAVAARDGFAWLWSWWGRDAPRGGDAMLQRYLEGDPDSTVPLLLLYEATGILEADASGRFSFDRPGNARRFVDDIAYLDQAYWRNPRHSHRFLRVDGRPVLFPWVSRNFTGAWPAAVAEARSRAPFYLVGSELVLDLEEDGVTPRVRSSTPATRPASRLRFEGGPLSSRRWRRACGSSLPSSSRSTTATRAPRPTIPRSSRAPPRPRASPVSCAR